MNRKLQFEQLHRVSGRPLDTKIGRNALKLYEDCLDRPLVWLEHRYVFMATEGIHVRGVANVEMRPAPGYAYLIGIAVAPEYRNQGIGKFMMKNLLQYASDQDCTHMQVIPKSNVEEFYQHLGFVQRSENSMYWIHRL